MSSDDHLRERVRRLLAQNEDGEPEERRVEFMARYYAEHPDLLEVDERVQAADRRQREGARERSRRHG
ncbi:MAG: hypothetical protein HYY96_04180 [Candidatus Tectomicrobia bacterium]|nr:hypothetical protein [Candidatus Tectomicrobia bacterium]